MEAEAPSTAGSFPLEPAVCASTSVTRSRTSRTSSGSARASAASGSVRRARSFRTVDRRSSSIIRIRVRSSSHCCRLAASADLVRDETDTGFAELAGATLCEAGLERNDSGTSGRLTEQAVDRPAGGADFGGRAGQTTVSSQPATRRGVLQVLERAPQTRQQLFDGALGNTAHG